MSKRQFSQVDGTEDGPPKKRRKEDLEQGEVEDDEQNSDNDIFGGFFGEDDDDEDGDVEMSDKAEAPQAALSAPKGMQISSVALRMMQKMGHKDGEGLGKTGQGISTAIEATVRGKKVGLGYQEQMNNITQRRHEYDNFEEKIEIKPQLHYIPALNHAPLDIKGLNPFLRFEPAVRRSGDSWDGTFGDTSIQQDLAAAKNVFNGLSGHAFRSARSRSNPFESIRHEIFQNRAALKICEMDVLSDMAVTQPKNIITYEPGRCDRVKNARRELLADLGSDISAVFGQQYWARELIYFADICAGPGGFTEYFLHVHKWQCRGFGFTLRGDEDFRPDKFNKNAPFHTFSRHYGKDNTGDITKSENIKHFRREVLKATRTGVHTVTADGGFDVSADFNSQELLSRRLVMCQFLTAFGILRHGGTFVCKLFDTFWPFTASIIYCARMYFEEVALIKPNQSRPANSERYVICTGFLSENRLPTENENPQTGGMPDIVRHLLNANEMWPSEDTHNAIAPIVPVDQMDPTFISFIREYNNNFALKEIFHLARLLKYVEDPNLQSDDQQTIRSECLKVWFGHKHPRIFIDTWFAHIYVTNRPHDVPGIDSRSRVRPARSLFEPPTSYAGGTREGYGEKLFRRIQFTYSNTENLDFRQSFKDSCDFMKYPVGRYWFAFAFGLKPRLRSNHHRRPPQHIETSMVVLVGAMHGVYEMRRVEYSPRVLQSFGDDFDYELYKKFFKSEKGEPVEDLYPCTRITNNLIRLPPDTVIDCVRIMDDKGVIKYNMIDAWVIGSKKVWERDFIERREFLRILYQGFGSQVLCLPNPRSLLTTLRDERLLRHQENLFILMLRTKRSQPPHHARPVPMKLWKSGGVGGSLQGLIDKIEEFDSRQ